MGNCFNKKQDNLIQGVQRKNEPVDILIAQVEVIPGLKIKNKIDKGDRNLLKRKK